MYVQLLLWAQHISLPAIGTIGHKTVYIMYTTQNSF